MITVHFSLAVLLKDEDDETKIAAETVRGCINVKEQVIKDSSIESLTNYLPKFFLQDKDMFEALKTRCAEKAKRLVGQDVELTPYPDEEEEEHDTTTAATTN